MTNLRKLIEQLKFEPEKPASQDATSDKRYQEIITLLTSWDGADSDALLQQLRDTGGEKPKLSPLDMGDAHSPVSELLGMVNDVAERLEKAPHVQEWTPATPAKPEPRQRTFETAELIRQRNLRLVK